MPLVEITMVAGRTPDQKKALITQVTDAVEASLGGQRSAIRLAIREVPAEHWAIGGETIAERQAREAAASTD